jgi:hypothetical protein
MQQLERSAMVVGLSFLLSEHAAASIWSTVFPEDDGTSLKKIGQRLAAHITTHARKSWYTVQYV